MQLGEVYEITHKDGCTVQGKLLKTWEDEEFEWFRFDILDNGQIDKYGNPDPEYRYIVDYSQRKTADYSGIEKATNMPTAYAGKMMVDFNWGFYPDAGEQRRQVSMFLDKFRQFLDGGRGVYIYSRTKGSGKTLLASCIGNEVMRRFGIRIKFINVADYIQRVYDKTAEEFNDATVLILDDIGAQNDEKGNAAQILYNLVNQRYSNRRLTIFTSNMPIDKCADDDRTWQRVYEMAPVEIKIPEVSVRKSLADRTRRAFMESIA